MTPPADSSAMSSLQPSSTSTSDASAQGVWWCGNASTESELLSAAVLCAAIGTVSSSSNTSSSENNNDEDLVRARQELEARIRQSPLPHDLLFPVLEFRRDFVLMETSRSILCAVRATAHRDILETVLGSTLPLSQPFEYRFGGARIHVPFWKRAQRLDLQAAHRRAKRAKKMLLLCGHSIGGSIAQLGFCELVYQHLPINVRLQMEKLDYDQKQKDKLSATDSAEAYTPGPSNRSTIYKILEAYPDRTALAQSLPNVLAVGFGSPYSSSYGISSFLEPFGLSQRMITFVNEQDCIPGILNVAQSAAMLAKTTERIVTITKATKTLLNLLPARMQQVLIGLSSTAAAGAASTSGGHSVFPSATTAYITMSLSMLQNSFQKLREYNVVKDTSSLRYAPCGTYIFLSKSGSSFQVFHDTQQIVDALNAESDATTTLTGNSILQHLMSAYVDAVAKRSTSIQINATMNYYERLSVARNATQREIRSAYRSLALKWHPDRWSHQSTNLQEREMAETIFKLLAESYEVLSDPVARKEYDAHLAKAPSLTEEFVRNGTVYGKTLDEAIATFKEMFDRGSGLVSRATSRFSSSSSSVVGQPIRRTQTSSGSLMKNNHDNLFAPDRIRVARKVGIGAEQQDKIMYLQPEELVPGDLPAPRGGGSGKVGLKTISVVGGAVAVGASVALIVSAWSQYSESSKRQRQAETVRNMSGNHLLLLMEDHINLMRAHKVKMKSKSKTTKKVAIDTKPTVLQLDSASGHQQQPTILGDAEVVPDAIVVTTTTTTASELVVTEEVEDDDFDNALSEFELIDEFYDCVAEFDAAELEAFAEDEFYECVDLAEDIAAFFDTEEEQKQEKPQIPDIVLFPEGSTVNTPFGLGIVEKWRDDSSSAVIRFTAQSSALHVGYIQKSDLSRGAEIALRAASESLEAKRTALAERVIADYQLGEPKGAKRNFQEIVRASKDGALDSGIRAAGGVVLAKGMARTSTALGGAVAAPLTIASILVDIGKEYYDYRTKHTERKSQGVLSETSERLLMKDFRLKAGQHIAGGTAAAAGASLGAYSVASAVGFWTGVGIAGPLGVVAATGAAVVGGMLGFFAGTKAYNGYTASYFNSHKYAKEHIDRLELGARIMFNEYDPEGNGEISKEHCIQIMTKLYEASSAVSEDGYQQTVDVLQSEGFEGPVTWGMFWEWVSTEAARSLRALEHEESKPLTEPVPGEGSWWSSYMEYFSYGSLNGAVTSAPEIAAPKSCMYASVAIVLGYKFQDLTQNGPSAATSPADADTASGDDGEVDNVSQEDTENLVVLRAQLEALVNSGDVTIGDSFQLNECLDSEDFLVRESARKTIEALQSGQIDGGGLITEGFFGVDGTSENEDSGAIVTKSRADTKRPETQTQTKRKSEKELKPLISKEEQDVDVLCSLLSTQGLREFLHAHNIAPTDARRTHEDLHCLALQVATKASAVEKPPK